MAKSEWGEKHRCSSCSKPFYDMKKDPIICPMCGSKHVPEKLLKSRKTGGQAKVVKPKPEVVPAEENTLLGDEEILKTEDGTGLADEEEDTDLSGVVSAPAKDEEL